MIKTAVSTKTAATSNIVTTSEAKYHLKVDYGDATDNTYIDTLCEAAQRTVEAYTNRCFSDTTFYFYLSRFPVGGIVLPFSPVKSITAITYYDEDNSLQTLSSDDYFYNIYDEPCVIGYVGGSYPAVYEYRTDAIRVEFVCGYTSPDEIPPACEHAVKVLLTDMYENRTDVPRERFTIWKQLAYPSKVFHAPTENVR